MSYGDKKVVKCQTKKYEEKEIQLLEAYVCCKQDSLQFVDKRAIVAARMGME